jgi:limonene-1,2-epoxide hydrolase
MTPTSTATREKQVAVVESFLDCVVRKDFDRLPIAPDYTAQSPLTPKLSGQAAVDYLRNVAQAIKAIRIEQHVVEGNRVATLFVEDTVHGPLPVFSLFEIEGGRIKDARVFYDASRIRPSPESSRR